jgi:nucleoside-diphosphate-sugar epimerase
MKDCVIGHTGFIGSHLSNRVKNASLYNSKNIFQILGKQFSTVYCAGNYGTKWLANKNPNDDWKNIQLLISCLNGIKADRFILISTIDVYDNPILVTEKDKPSKNSQSAYGKHRYDLETFVTKKFNNYNIFRLPIVYGPRFKKNIIFDLMNNNQIDKIDPRSRVQLYHVKNLYDDIQIAIEHDLDLINLATEPVTARELATGIFNKNLEDKQGDFFLTDMRSQYKNLYNSSGDYLYCKKEILQEVKDFICH